MLKLLVMASCPDFNSTDWGYGIKFKSVFGAEENDDALNTRLETVRAKRVFFMRLVSYIIPLKSGVGLLIKLQLYVISLSFCISGIKSFVINETLCRKF